MNPWIVYGAVFGLIAAIVWLILDWTGNRSSRAEQRLDDLSDPSSRKRAEAKGGSSMSRMLQAAAPALSAPLQPKSELEQSKIKQSLSHAGFRGESAAAVYMGLKVVGLAAGFIIGGGISFFVMGFTVGALIRTVACAGILFYLPSLVLWWLGRKRKESIFLGLPDALDLMVVCVEAGLGLDQAMRKVAEEMKRTYRVISDEFSLCNLQLQVGRGRTQVLQELGSRSGVDDLKSLASILIQADKFGSSIAQALRVQSDAMRTRRRQIAEEKAAKTAVQLIFPLVLFIFPGIFVVLVGPAAITMVREMFPAMGG
ncbi:MAG: type II secretion system F family protein [Planctomycetales bacterium]|nr:type II secretion system F family protein [Planctomycetales bacterium]